LVDIAAIEKHGAVRSPVSRAYGKFMRTKNPH